MLCLNNDENEEIIPKDLIKAEKILKTNFYNIGYNNN